MAHKSKQNRPGQKAGSQLDLSSRSSEFDDAVTTDISDVLTTAFDEHQVGDPGDLFITDVSLTEHFDLDSDDVLAPGFLLRDRFEIVELVHTAGMSHIYKAIDQRRSPEGSGDIHVAIKIMRPSVVPTDQARLSLQREAFRSQSLSHPNIINIFDFDDHDGQFFLVMEWLEGESVNALLRRTSGKGVETGLARTVIAHAAAGVEHAHRNGVVHADINPSNIFITDTHEIKLLDFGVARSTRVPEQTEDAQFTWVTRTYASPEVLSGLPPVVEDDVFSLACVVYRLLSGKHPFGGTLSLVAMRKNQLVEKIPGLTAGEWELLRRALSYERSDRPSSVCGFVTWSDDLAGDDEPAARPAWRFLRPQLMWPAATAAAVILVSGFWLYQRGTVGETAAPAEPALPEETVVAEPTISASEALVIAATRALDEGQLVAPDEVNARALFRMALSLEPDNAEALRGLRTISDDFVQQAHEALNRDDASQAYAALTVATETDSANPAIEIVEQLLIAKGNGELADARLAVATDDLDSAVQRLSRAEQYRHIDPVAVQALRRQVEERRQSGLLLDRLAAADAYIVADRLLLPEGDNAYALLLELRGQYGDDPRVLATMEQLGERLLTQAALAIAAADVAQASELLDAVDALGVLTSEIEEARLSLNVADTQDVPVPQVADEQSAGGMDLSDAPDSQLADEQSTGGLDLSDAPDSQLADEQSTGGLDLSDAPDSQVAVEQSAAAADPGSVQSPQFAEEPFDNTVLELSASQPTLPVETEPEAVTPPATLEISRRSLQEIGITEYIAPRFPRGARLRSISGMVDVGFVVDVDGSTESIEVLHSEPGEVFSKSAVDAVSQWRFEPREEAINARVTLRFDLVQ